MKIPEKVGLALVGLGAAFIFRSEIRLALAKALATDWTIPPDRSIDGLIITPEDQRQITPQPTQPETLSAWQRYIRERPEVTEFLGEEGYTVTPIGIFPEIAGGAKRRTVEMI